MNNCCSNLYILSTVACQLAECLTKEEAAQLSADLVVLSDMLANILVRNESCETPQMCNEENDLSCGSKSSR